MGYFLLNNTGLQNYRPHAITILETHSQYVTLLIPRKNIPPYLTFTTHNISHTGNI